MSRVLKLSVFAVVYLALFCSCSEDKGTEPVQPSVPTISTTAVSAISQTTAESGGTITSDGGASITARGVCWSVNTSPTIADNKTTDGTGVGNFTSSLTGLTDNTPYYVRAYATNSAGTGYGSAQSFTTLVQLSVPTISTATVSAISETTAESGGTITSDGGASITARGVCWSMNISPTIADNKTTDGTGIGSFTSSLMGLIADTSYYVRAYATNSIGTGYGSAQSFTTMAPPGTVTDIDGNVYQTIKIGTQIWMAENLAVTHFRNGDTIPNVPGGLDWFALNTAGYCEYNNSLDSAAIYGRLYNWYAATDSRNIAPEGWHLPSHNEFQILLWHLGTDGGGKLKEAGTTHWSSPNTGATNESGFTALPAGMCGSQGLYIGMPQQTWFWTSTEYLSARAYVLELGAYSAGSIFTNLAKCSGLSIRCIKD